MPASRKRRKQGWQAAHERTRRLEVGFASQLRRVAHHIGELIGRFTPADPAATPAIQAAMRNYSLAIEPWAQSVVRRMQADVSARDLAAWIELAGEMRKGIKEELRRAPTGMEAQRLLREQVTLITSLPLDAAQRVHEWTLTALADGSRYAEAVEAIRRSGEVSVARANLIARTETARTAAVFTQARAQYVGADTYIWRSSGDSDVRPSHRKLNATVHRWDNPPVSDVSSHGREYRSHPGCIWNCRCYPEPIVPA